MRMSSIQLVIDDAVDGELLNAVESPESVDDLRSYLLEAVEFIEDRFGFDLCIKYIPNKRREG